MDPKRIAIAVALSLAVFAAWQKFFAPLPPSHQPQQPQTGTTASAPAAAPSAPTSPAAPAPGAERPPEETATLESDEARFVLSSWGASLRQVELKEPKFERRESGKPPQPYQMIGTTTPETAPLLVSFPKADF